METLGAVQARLIMTGVGERSAHRLAGIVEGRFGAAGVKALGGGIGGFSQAMSRAVLVGRDQSEAAQVGRVEEELVKQGFTRNQAQGMASELRDVVYAQTDSPDWRTASGQSISGENIGNYVTQYEDPRTRNINIGRRRAVESMFQIEDIAKKAGFGSSTASQRLLHSLVTQDGKGIKDTFGSILTDLTDEDIAKFRKSVSGLTASHQTLAEGLNTDDPKQAAAAMNRFNESLKNYTGELQSFYDLLGNEKYEKDLLKADETEAEGGTKIPEVTVKNAKLDLYIDGEKAGEGVLSSGPDDMEGSAE
jgi:hypothetical protein